MQCLGDVKHTDRDANEQHDSDSGRPFQTDRFHDELHEKESGVGFSAAYPAKALKRAHSGATAPPEGYHPTGPPRRHPLDPRR